MLQITGIRSKQIHEEVIGDRGINGNLVTVEAEKYIRGEEGLTLVTIDKGMTIDERLKHGRCHHYKVLVIT